MLRIAREHATGSIRSSHTRPFSANKINLASDLVIREETVAIILQGPIVHAHNFTKETVKLYKKLFSQKAIIIVSTWNDEDVKSIKEISELGAIVITNEKPKSPGIKNINLQIVSSLAGIRKARSLGASYILKTRTDHRMHAPNIEEFLLSTLRAFPLVGTNLQRERIVAASLNTYKYRPYSISDMLLFGNIDDIEAYFTLPEDTRTRAEFNDIGTWSQGRFCEVYLATSFLEKTGRTLSFTLGDSWRTYAERFCVIDAQTLDLFWYKYEYWHEYRDLDYQNMRTTQELTFREWLILYARLENKKDIPENVLKKQFGETL